MLAIGKFLIYRYNRFSRGAEYQMECLEKVLFQEKRAVPTRTIVAPSSTAVT